jgi:hypothetical protein
VALAPAMAARTSPGGGEPPEAGLSGAATADLRDMPRDVQEIAFAKGIPYIPADRKDRS